MDVGGRPAGRPPVVSGSVILVDRVRGIRRVGWTCWWTSPMAVGGLLSTQLGVRPTDLRNRRRGHATPEISHDSWRWDPSSDHADTPHWTNRIHPTVHRRHLGRHTHAVHATGHRPLASPPEACVSLRRDTDGGPARLGRPCSRAHGKGGLSRSPSRQVSHCPSDQEPCRPPSGGGPRRQLPRGESTQTVSTQHSRAQSSRTRSPAICDEYAFVRKVLIDSWSGGGDRI